MKVSHLILVCLVDGVNQLSWPPKNPARLIQSKPTHLTLRKDNHLQDLWSHDPLTPGFCYCLKGCRGSKPTKLLEACQTRIAWEGSTCGPFLCTPGVSTGGTKPNNAKFFVGHFEVSQWTCPKMSALKQILPMEGNYINPSLEWVGDALKGKTTPPENQIPNQMTTPYFVPPPSNSGNEGLVPDSLLKME